ncbi:MAG: CDP-alcohol phosphatidyltransferase family protein [Polyangiales bacterium]
MNFLLATGAGTAERLRRRVLGIPVALRALLQAVEAGAAEIEVSGPHANMLLDAAHDARVTVPVRAYADARRERIVVEANALVAPELLRALQPGEALLADNEHLVAARKAFRPGDKPTTPLAGLPVLEYPKGDKLWAVFLLDEGDAVRAERALLRAQTEPSDAWLTRNIFRVSVGLLFVWVRAGMPPSSVTALALVLALVAARLLAQGHGGAPWLGALLGLVSLVLSSVDGPLARVTHRVSPTGAALSRVVSDATVILLGAGALFGVMERGVGAPVEWLTPLVVGGAAAWLVSVAVLDVRFGAEPRPSAKSWIDQAVHRDTVVLLVIAAALTGLAQVAATVWLAAAAGRLVRAGLSSSVR